MNAYAHSHSLIPDPQIGFVVSSVSVSEGMTSVELAITTSAPGYVELYLEAGTATGEASLHNYNLLFLRQSL